MDTTKKYNVIYADPPWTFKTFSNKGKDRSPEKHYSVMTVSYTHLTLPTIPGV